MSLFDSLRLERATALSCSPHLLQVQVVVGGEDVNLEEEKEGVRLTGLTLTSASLTKEGKVGEAAQVHCHSRSSVYSPRYCRILSSCSC